MSCKDSNGIVSLEDLVRDNARQGYFGRERKKMEEKVHCEKVDLIWIVFGWRVEEGFWMGSYLGIYDGEKYFACVLTCVSVKYCLVSL